MSFALRYSNGGFEFFKLQRVYFIFLFEFILPCLLGVGNLSLFRTLFYTQRECLLFLCTRTTFLFATIYPLGGSFSL